MTIHGYYLLVEDGTMTVLELCEYGFVQGLERLMPLWEGEARASDDAITSLTVGDGWRNI